MPTPNETGTSLADPLAPGDSSRWRYGTSARLGSLAVLFVVEKVLLNGFVNSERAQSSAGLAASVRLAQHWGFRFLVA